MMQSSLSNGSVYYSVGCCLLVTTNIINSFTKLCRSAKTSSVAKYCTHRFAYFTFPVCRFIELFQSELTDADLEEELGPPGKLHLLLVYMYVGV